MTPTTAQLRANSVSVRPPTVEELQKRLSIIAKKSAGRKRTLKQINKSHMLLSRLHDELVDKYNNLYDDYYNVLEENKVLNMQNLALQRKPWLTRLFARIAGR
jgi:hypothetical protein